ncbi:hypothetical protein F7725_004923 [Dissostichus mawsoni]|uniref:G-protein coupled receptors family 1 profile domain-containing protein n=1 Tax=Dissostichus mawsoni TaxID=36200 RepID=A0A7J5XLN9_DISMA|nr:hypothetical protein F7725_004923 [Dissostichus mawsoni]
MSINNGSYPFQVQFSSHVCLNSTTGLFVLTAFSVTNVFIHLLLCALIFCLEFQRWRRQKSTFSSHADCFTFNMMAMEMFVLVGLVLFCMGFNWNNWWLIACGMFCCSLIIPGRSLFHCLTCMERYLAVVHPITYLRLKTTSGVRIRNICIGCAWMLSFGWMSVKYAHLPNWPIFPSLVFVALSLFVSSFSSVSVLRVLRRASPGERPGVNVSTGGLEEAGGDQCVVLIVTLWFGLPSSMVIPLLFLHREGKRRQ